MSQSGIYLCQYFEKLSPQYFVLDSETPALCCWFVVVCFLLFLLFCSMHFYFPALLNAACHVHTKQFRRLTTKLSHYACDTPTCIMADSI